MLIAFEGNPIQELSAVAVLEKTILSTYHKYAYCTPTCDLWSRYHVHGLDPSYLLMVGFSDEQTLVKDFKRWLQQFSCVKLYAKDPNRAQMFLSMSVNDIALPSWTERHKRYYHHAALRAKLSEHPFCHLVCKRKNHKYFHVKSISGCTTHLEKVKVAYCYHCSWYDVYEMYLFHLE